MSEYLLDREDCSHHTIVPGVDIHTATGQHLEELEAVFGDVKVSSFEEDLRGD